MDRKQVYDFFKRLTEKLSPEEAIATLKDILVDYYIFNGEVTEAFGDLDKDVKSLITQGLKINAVKLVRERTGLGLKDAKDYVEGNYKGGSVKQEKFEDEARKRLKKLAEDYQIPL